MPSKILQTGKPLKTQQLWYSVGPLTGLLLLLGPTQDDTKYVRYAKTGQKYFKKKIKLLKTNC